MRFNEKNVTIFAPTLTTHTQKSALFTLQNPKNILLITQHFAPTFPRA